MKGSTTPRGSLWNRWDPHIHAPGTVLNDQFSGPDPWSGFLDRLEAADPPVRALGITDYYTMDSYLAVRGCKESGRLQDVALLFPNIEMRLAVGLPKGSAVNIHLLVSPERDDHVEEAQRFLRRLQMTGVGGETYDCDSGGLEKLGRAYDPSVIDPSVARKVGCEQFKVNLDQFIEIYERSAWARQNTLIAVSASSGDGTSGLARDSQFSTLRRKIEGFAHIIFASSPQQREFWLGQRSLTADEVRRQYGSCKPCLHGCDAHDLAKVANPDQGRRTWIKGDVTFEALHQACIEPEGRTFVGEQPPAGALASQTITDFSITEATWLETGSVIINPGLVAIIGSRGSGKTALADLIAAAAYAPSTDHRSFNYRARQFLTRSTAEIGWQSGDRTKFNMRDALSAQEIAEPRVRYLSQQFVERLCSSEGLNDELMDEVERVIFQTHPPTDRMGTGNFQEFLELRLESARSKRQRAEARLAGASNELNIERERIRGAKALERQRDEKMKLVEQDTAEMKRLLGSGTDQRIQRLTQLLAASNERRSQLDVVKRRQLSLTGLVARVSEDRSSSFPAALQTLKDDFSDARLTDEQWERFRLRFEGDVDTLLSWEVTATEKLISEIMGAEVRAPANDQSSLLPADADISKSPLQLLEAEIERIRRQVGIDQANAKRHTQLSEKVNRETAAIAKLNEALELARTAPLRIQDILRRRSEAYRHAFAALLEEEAELSALYAPLEEVLGKQPGTLGKLTFTVQRNVDITAWATAGEQLLDLRATGRFRGQGALKAVAERELLSTWRNGTAELAATAIEAFRTKYDPEFRDRAAALAAENPQEHKQWIADFPEWLYGTSHISVSYGVSYGGTDITQLSPGTRGIVLLLLYLLVDHEDDRPLIIDQPEENLDTRSIFDELVDRFRDAKLRRQIIIVTHNANLVVNTDADQVIVATCRPGRRGRMPIISYESGGLENPSIRAKVCDILEGGEAAFRERARRLRVNLGGT